MKNWEEIRKHLIFNDPQMLDLINNYGDPNILINFNQSNLFNTLIDSIISQQLSTKVARIIKSRLFSIEKIDQFTPKFFLDLKFNDMRSCGLSGAKCRYIKSISDVCFESPDFLNDLISKPDDKVIEE